MNAQEQTEKITQLNKLAMGIGTYKDKSGMVVHTPIFPFTVEFHKSTETDCIFVLAENAKSPADHNRVYTFEIPIARLKHFLGIAYEG